MPHEFINPNWHVTFLHFPLGLLTIGVLIELFSFLWPHSSVRTAARWMILIGALTAIPTTTLGLYAMRDVVSPGPIDLHQRWSEVLPQSTWNDAQWEFMRRHIITMAIATGLFVIGAIAWLGATDEGRRKLHWPVLVAILIGVGVMLVGAWYSGEAVYQHGTAVMAASQTGTPPPQQTSGALAPPETAPTDTAETTSGHASPAGVEAQTGPPHVIEGTQPPSGIMYYIPPLQLHLLLAGITVAVAAGAIGLTARRWSEPAISDRSRVETGPVPEMRQETPRPSVDTGESAAATPPVVVTTLTPITRVYPARFWLIALIFAVCTALAGLWFTGDWKLQAGLVEPLRGAGRRTEVQRLFFHVIFGVSIAILILLMSILTRWVHRWRGIKVLFIILLLLAVAVQMWLGILMLFDSHHGPLTGFSGGV